jgi:beta-fructofuranosidase
LLTLPGQYIGDSWYFVEDDRVHCFFLTAPETIPLKERWNHWDIGHAVSTDLYKWEYIGLALYKGKPGSWDSQKLATGSVIAHGGRFWMAYTGIESVDGFWMPRTGMAVSDDLYTWTKLEINPTTEPDGTFYGSGSLERKISHSWRDPFLMRNGDRFYQYICARPPNSSSAGIVGLASSPDLMDWSLEPPVEVAQFARELEVPQIYRIGDLYYLVFCTTSDRILPTIKAQTPDHLYRSSDYVMVAESPLGPFQMYGTGDIHLAHQELIPYASQLVHWQGDWVLLGTVVISTRSQLEHDYITDPIPIHTTATGLRAIGMSDSRRGQPSHF